MTNNQNLDNLDPDLNLLEGITAADMCKYQTVSDFCSLNLDCESFSLVNYNIRSFSKNSPVFLSMLESLNISFKCIVLSETWNTENSLSSCFLPDYEDFHTFRPTNHVYRTSGGVSVFCAKNLKPIKKMLFHIVMHQ